VKAITRDRFGSPDVLELRDVPEPVVGDDDVLVRIRAASVNPRDWHFLRGSPSVMRLQFGLRGPKDQLLGSDVAGEVEAVGRNVTGLRPGAEVYTELSTGAFATYAAVPHERVVPKPVNLTFEEAAAVPLAALTALQGLRDHAALQAGQRVLVIGAAGGVGSFAVQLANWMGAEVTGVCSTGKIELVRSLGAHDVVDYTREDPGALRGFDLVFQLAGMRSPGACRRMLVPGGTLLAASGDSDGHLFGPIGRMAKAMVLSPFVSQRLVPFIARASGEDLLFMKELIEGGKVRPVVDRTYALNDVAEAIRYLEQGHARGKVVITV
jgi:NADPH:quinone reductase-like Zn-dependent oxidoreductase